MRSPTTARAKSSADGNQMPDRLVGDPSPRSVDALTHAIKSVEDKFRLEFDAQKEAVRLLQAFADRQPTTDAVNHDLKALKELSGSEQASLKELIKTMFDGNKTALDAALKTQNETLQEIKASFGKQFDNVSKRIDDLKERIDRGDGRTTGMGNAGSILLGVCVIIGVVIAAATFIATRT